MGKSMSLTTAMTVFKFSNALSFQLSIYVQYTLLVNMWIRIAVLYHMDTDTDV